MNTPSPLFQTPRWPDIVVSLVMTVFAAVLWCGVIASIFSLPQRLQANSGNLWEGVAVLGMIGCLAIMTSGIAAMGLFGPGSTRARTFWYRPFVISTALFLLAMLGATVFEPHSALRFTWKDAWFFGILLAPLLWRKLKSSGEPPHPQP